MNLLRPGIVFVLVSQGLYWLGVVLKGSGEPLNFLGLLLAQGYRTILFGMTGLGVLLILAGLVARLRRRSPG